MPDAHPSSPSDQPPSAAGPPAAPARPVAGLQPWLSPGDGAQQVGPARGTWPFAPQKPPQTGRLVLTADPRSAHRTREFAHKQLADWGLEHLIEDTVLIASELFTNALVHASTRTRRPAPLQLIFLRHRRRLQIVMTDPSDEPPKPAGNPDPVAFSESGRGLYIVTALSLQWGWAHLALGGKAVWATLDIG